MRKIVIAVLMMFSIVAFSQNLGELRKKAAAYTKKGKAEQDKVNKEKDKVDDKTKGYNPFAKKKTPTTKKKEESTETKSPTTPKKSKPMTEADKKMLKTILFEIGPGVTTGYITSKNLFFPDAIKTAAGDQAAELENNISMLQGLGFLFLFRVGAFVDLMYSPVSFFAVGLETGVWWIGLPIGFGDVKFGFNWYDIPIHAAIRLSIFFIHIQVSAGLMLTSLEFYAGTKEKVDEETGLKTGGTGSFDITIPTGVNANARLMIGGPVKFYAGGGYFLSIIQYWKFEMGLSLELLGPNGCCTGKGCM